MTIEKFYTILYFLEYFRVKCDNKLRNAVKNIWCSLVESDEMQIFDIENVSFHFIKQDYFSHALYKKISQEYLKLLNNGNDSKISFFIKEHESYIYDEYNGIFTGCRKHMLVFDDEFDSFFYKKVVVNHKSQCLFLMFLNTLDIKYLHIKGYNNENSKSFCFILQNLKKKIDEIVFFKYKISDEVICSLNANLNFKNLKKIVFIKSKIDTSLIFIEHLGNINEFIFYEKHYYGRDTLPGIKEGDLNIAEFILQNLKPIHPQHSTEESIKENEKIPKERKDFYLKLLEEVKFRDKVKIIEYFECKNENLKIECFGEYKGCFNNISITFKNLNDKRFIITENTILEENIKCIEIKCSEIKSDFLRDIFTIKKLESLEIKSSHIYIENESFLNESIKYFGFYPYNSECFCGFFKLINMMIGLQKIYIYTGNIIMLNRSVDQIFYITELYIWYIYKMIDLLQHLAKNEKFDFKATNKDIFGSEYPKDSLKFAFPNYNLSSIKKLSIENFSIGNSNVNAFSNLLCLKELDIAKINYQNISFSELFCAKQEYKIKRMNLEKINISEKDLIFIANLKKIEVIHFRWCDIQGKAYFWIKFLFVSENYIELIKYGTREDNLPEETINFIKEKFKTKYIVIK
ncbi:hypothetical protein CWI36_1956p0010 [Hamiltosporidium magnivora]|uniref:Uncharacterized protein n=1 Tax=Hamiltosporidium magnivora TaxID=148818 RepID=A0A4Q9KX59_9MICR|nr:hypothetical protein CWI36_1956p0010 [Hamiltosporidium magnivora]